VTQAHSRSGRRIAAIAGRPAAVLVSPDEYDSWKETLAIRADRDLMREIGTGLAALKARKARLYTLDELLG